MNAERREEISLAVALLTEAKAQLETAANDEQGLYNNLPKNLKSSAKGQRMKAAAEALTNAASKVQEAIEEAEFSMSQ